MKTLLIIRHAKSSWDGTALNDFERPLNDRGKKDAPIMAQRLLDKKIVIDAFVSSPAKRAKKTAELFCTTYKKNTDDIIFVSALYHATPETIFTVVEQLDDTFSSVAIFSHNDGITEFANKLAENFVINDMPTCSVCAVKIEIDNWKDFTKSKKELLFFYSPEKI